MTQPNKPHTVHIETFGCQMNEYDSELVRSLLRKAGFEFTEDRERADVLLNPNMDVSIQILEGQEV